MKKRQKENKSKSELVLRSRETDAIIDPINKSDIDRLRKAYFNEMQAKAFAGSSSTFILICFLLNPLLNLIDKTHPQKNSVSMHTVIFFMVFIINYFFYYLRTFYQIKTQKDHTSYHTSLELISKKSVTLKSNSLNANAKKIHLIFTFAMCALVASSIQFQGEKLIEFHPSFRLSAQITTFIHLISSYLFSILYRNECVVSWDSLLNAQQFYLSKIFPNLKIVGIHLPQNGRQPQFYIESNSLDDFKLPLKFIQEISPNYCWILHTDKRSFVLDIDVSKYLLKDSEAYKILSAIKLQKEKKLFLKNNMHEFQSSEKILTKLSNNRLLWYRSELVGNDTNQLKPTFISSLLPELYKSELYDLFKNIIHPLATVTIISYPYGSKLKITGFVDEPDPSTTEDHLNKIATLYGSTNAILTKRTLSSKEGTLSETAHTPKKSWSDLFSKPLSYIPSLFGSRSNASLAPITTVDENWQQRLLDHGVVDLPLRNANGTQTAWIRIHQPTLDLLNDDSKLIKMLDDYVHGDRDVITALRASDENKYGSASFKIKKWIDPSSSDVRAVFVEAKNIVGDDHLPIYELGIKEKHENTAVKIVRSKNPSPRY